MDWQYHRKYRHLSKHNMSRLESRPVATASDLKEGVEEECYHHSYHHICTYALITDVSKVVANINSVILVRSAFYSTPKSPLKPTERANKQRALSTTYNNRQALTHSESVHPYLANYTNPATQAATSQPWEPRTVTYNNIPKNKSHKYSSGDSTRKIRVILDRHPSPRTAASL